jgi:hypothetical protein
MVFYSKRDKQMAVSNGIMIFILVGGAFAVLTGDDHSFGFRVTIALSLFFSGGYVLFMLLNPRCVLENKYVYIWETVYRTKVDIDTIHRIKVINREQIELCFLEKKPIRISPMRQREFVAVLLAINPCIRLEADKWYFIRKEIDRLS